MAFRTCVDIAEGRLDCVISDSWIRGAVLPTLLFQIDALLSAVEHASSLAVEFVRIPLVDRTQLCA